MKAFWAGLVAGLAGLSLAGATIRSPGWSAGFTRLDLLTHPQSQYYPTARQIAQLVDDDQGRITVVVGGSSVFHGVGQQDKVLWTRRLQRLLGDRYRVVNLAQPSGRANDFGNIGAEFLIKTGRSVIYLADTRPTLFAADLEHSFYQRQMVDALLRDYLIPLAARSAMFTPGPTTPTLTASLLGGYLDRWLNFNDLWNYVSYEIVTLNWSPLLANTISAAYPAIPRPFSGFAARKLMKADQPTPEAIRANLPANSDAAEILICRAWITPPDSPKWTEFEQMTLRMMPEQLRRRSVIITNLRNPRHVSGLTADEQAGFYRTAEQTSDRLARLGFGRTAIVARDFTDDDYADGLHLSASGGGKLAEAAAPMVVSLAQQLGYAP